ncbi:DUF6745 domain-containing protein [Acaryochloris sp. IP29b_bin.137]|uniref:DUF6745 domain-containing protein n=1 Tax=Acaryochloris sp. IP29b_bin.137 TaxID=2969217 RepID=UPI002632CDD8|nr:hypothetical protein [Acaryochloris sp. IP29b_bin.137]
MPHRLITMLTEEQETALPHYRNKWRSIALLTEPINEEKVADVIKATYAISNYAEPEILFYVNPLEAIKQILTIRNFEIYIGHQIRCKFRKRIIDHLQHVIQRQLDADLFTRLRNQIQFPEFPYYPTEDQPQVSFFPIGVERCTESQLLADLNRPEFEFTNIYQFSQTLFRPAEASIWGCMFDFCISVLKLQHDQQKWRVLQDLIQECGFIFLFEKVCIVCERPCKLMFDSDNQLHGEGEPALRFTDGYGINARHGVLEQFANEFPASL